MKNIVIIFSLLFLLFSCEETTTKEKEKTCREWEVLEDGICKLKENGCIENQNCDDGYECNLADYTCQKIEEIPCDPVCSTWESCVNQVCILNEGNCNTDISCSDAQMCDLDTHLCKDKEKICDLECETWESCVFDDDASMKCMIISDFSWKHQALIIEDEIVNGSSFMMPTDSISYGYNSETGRIISQFGRKDDKTFLWDFDLSTGIEKKLDLTGDVFSATENFCQDTDWCQFISYNKNENKYMILGSSTNSLMLVTPEGVGELQEVSGSRIPDNMINVHHISVDNGSRFLFFGGLTPSGASSKIYEFSNLTWKILYDKMPQIAGNCIAYDSENNYLYSFGGRIATNSGNTFTMTSKYFVIDLNNDIHNEFELPTQIGTRKDMSCTYDSKRKYIYLYGGNIVNDRWDEYQNEYFNDLWVYDIANNTWSNILEQTTPGTFTEPDDRGDRTFDGDPTKPNFGQNQGKLIYDEKNDRLLIIGSIPMYTHEQLFILNLIQE
jgi:hypothetical protein